MRLGLGISSLSDYYCCPGQQYRAFAARLKCAFFLRSTPAFAW
jgi:hypothetical protein